MNTAVFAGNSPQYRFLDVNLARKNSPNKKVLQVEEKLRFIDLFAGIGGIRLGFERAFTSIRDF